MATDSRFTRGAEKLSARIKTIRAKLSLPVLTKEIGELLLARTLRRFDAEVDPDGRRWRPLAIATLERKRREGYGDKKMLVRTQKMRDAIQIIRGRNASTVYANTGAGVRIGIADPEIAEYARVQNYGSGTIPARRFLGIGRLDVKSVDSFLRRRGADAVNG